MQAHRRRGFRGLFLERIREHGTVKCPNNAAPHFRIAHRTAPQTFGGKRGGESCMVNQSKGSSTHPRGLAFGPIYVA